MEFQIIIGGIALLLWVLGIMLIYWSSLHWLKMQQVDQAGHVTVARTTKAGWRNTANAHVFTTEYEFVVDGKPFKATIDYNMQRLAPYGTFEVRYLPGEPQWHYISAVGKQTPLTITGIGMGIGLLGFTLYMFLAWVFQVI